MSTVALGATLDGILTTEGAPIWSPPVKTAAKDVDQVQEPTFSNRHVLTKVEPGATTVPSGMVSSAMNCARLQGCAPTGWGAKTVPGTNCNIRVRNIAIGMKTLRKDISTSF